MTAEKSSAKVSHSAHDRAKGSSHLSLVMVFCSNPGFKNLDSFLLSVASKGFITAKDVLNLLFSAPEEENSAHLEILC